MSPQSLTLYLAAAFTVTLSPGPDILTVLTRSIAQGRTAGIIASLGFATGLIAHTTAAALGLSALLQSSPRALFLIRLAGVLYLIYLAFRMILAKDPIALDQSNETTLPKIPLTHIYLQSILMNILNPKVILFFLAFLAQFIDQSQPLAPQFILLGTLFAATTILCFCTAAIIASTLSTRLRKSPKSTRPLRYLTALVFLLIAARLAIN